MSPLSVRYVSALDGAIGMSTTSLKALSYSAKIACVYKFGAEGPLSLWNLSAKSRSGSAGFVVVTSAFSRQDQIPGLCNATTRMYLYVPLDLSIFIIDKMRRKSFFPRKLSWLCCARALDLQGPQIFDSCNVTTPRSGVDVTRFPPLDLLSKTTRSISIESSTVVVLFSYFGSPDI